MLPAANNVRSALPSRYPTKYSVAFRTWASDLPLGRCAGSNYDVSIYNAWTDTRQRPGRKLRSELFLNNIPVPRAEKPFGFVTRIETTDTGREFEKGHNYYARFSIHFRFLRCDGGSACRAINDRKGGPLIYDAVNDFNTTGIQSSGSAWTYGTETTLNGAFTLLPEFAAIACDTVACTPSDALFDSYYFNGNGAGGPDIAYNNSAGTITYPVSPALVLPDNVLELGPGGSSGGPEFTVLRWTAQRSGTYSVSGFMENLRDSTTAQYVYMNGVEEYSQTYVGSTDLQQAPLSFGDLAILAGGTVDFIVDSGGIRMGMSSACRRQSPHRACRSPLPSP